MTLGIKQSDNVLLPAGRYPGTLTEVKETTGKKFGSEEEIPMIKINFSVVTKKGVVDKFKKVSPTNNKKGNLYKIACDLHPDGIITEELRMDVPKFEAFLQSCVGKRYMVTLNVNGEYNNIIGITPIAGDLPTVTQQDPEAPKFNDDDIPF